ncbi:hypothetical protein [Sphingomonas sp. ID0503]|uniref:hypothetical protein n=1 Tax=Sphingomonas sp. ID0503 TaxID=3399691 RepID=UPI003AFB5C53
MNHSEFGSMIGELLAKAETSDNVPGVAAAQMIAALLDKCDTARLPAILANPQVREWMLRTNVTENLLRRALTDSRKVRKAADEPAPLVLPPKRRKRAAPPLDEQITQRSTAATPSNSLFDEDDGFVPN